MVVDQNQGEISKLSEPRVLVIAGPGSGKTATLTAAVCERIVSGVAQPEGVSVITFTRRAAAELRQRIQAVLGADAKEVRVDTFHGWCYALICQYAEALGFLHKPVIVGPDEGKAIVDRLVKEVGLARRDPNDRERIIRQMLRTEGILRYDDIPVLALRVAGHAVVTDLFVDEFQDTNLEQALVYEAVPALRRFYVADPDQSIYGWNGAGVAIVDAYAKTAVIRSLDKTYRCAEAIADKARSLIAVNPRPNRSAIDPVRQGGMVRVISPAQAVDEIRHEIPGKRVGLLARYRADLDLVGELTGRGVVGKRQHVLQSAGIGAMMAYCLLPELPNSRHLMARVYCAESGVMGGTAEDAVRGEMLVGVKTGHRVLCEQFPALAEFYDDIKDLPLTEKILSAAGRLQSRMLIRDATVAEISRAAATFVRGVSLRDQTVQSFASWVATAETQDELEGQDAKGIFLLTMHGAKGMEFDEVYIWGLEEGKFPKNKRDLEEERRVMYVAMTRAREKLTLVEGDPMSRFITEAGCGSRHECE